MDGKFTLRDFIDKFISSCCVPDYSTTYIFTEEDIMDEWIEYYINNKSLEGTSAEVNITLYGDISAKSYLQDKWLDYEVEHFVAIAHNKIAVLLNRGDK